MGGAQAEHLQYVHKQSDKSALCYELVLHHQTCNLIANITDFTGLQDSLVYLTWTLLRLCVQV